MNKPSITVFIAAAALFAAASPASAQKFCPEGKTADGQCVNAELAQDLRTGTIVFTQPKLSMTNPPVLPSQDGQYFVPRDHHEIANLHGYPPITGPNGAPFSYTICAPTCITTTVDTGPRP